MSSSPVAVQCPPTGQVVELVSPLDSPATNLASVMQGRHLLPLEAAPTTAAGPLLILLPLSACSPPAPAPLLLQARCVATRVECCSKLARGAQPVASRCCLERWVKALQVPARIETPNNSPHPARACCTLQEFTPNEVHLGKLIPGMLNEHCLNAILQVLSAAISSRDPLWPWRRPLG